MRRRVFGVSMFDLMDGPEVSDPLACGIGHNGGGRVRGGAERPGRLTDGTTRGASRGTGHLGAVRWHRRARRRSTFDIEHGQIVGLIGPNGAGKTTMFNVISRVDNPGGGTITLRGDDLLSVRPE